MNHMKSDDLINRSALLEELRFKRVAVYGRGSMKDIDKVIESVETAPAVDAEPVRHGYWIPQDNTHTKFMCSDCKGRNHDGSGKYCSECGCKMDAEVNNDGSNSAEY